jgi:uncharacterized protein (TIGR00369 family)
LRKTVASSVRVKKAARMSTSHELAHDFVVALEAGDWERANELVPRTMPLNAQLELRFLGREGNTLSATMALNESVRTSVEGTVHGGMLATFADVVSAYAVIATHGARTGFLVTTELHIRYFRQPRSGPLKAEATVVHRGRQLMSTDCVISDADDRVLARSTATFTDISFQE